LTVSTVKLTDKSGKEIKIKNIQFNEKDERTSFVFESELVQGNSYNLIIN